MMPGKESDLSVRTSAIGAV